MQSFLKPPQNFAQILRQSLPALLFQFLRDAVEAFGDGTGDAGKGIAVAAQGNGGANNIFKTLSLQKRGDGFRDGFLTALHMAIGGADFVAGATQIVVKPLLDVVLDFCLATTPSAIFRWGCNGMVRSASAMH